MVRLSIKKRTERTHVKSQSSFRVAFESRRLAHLAAVEAAVHRLVADTAAQRGAQAGLKAAVTAALLLGRRRLLVLHAALGRVVALWLAVSLFVRKREARLVFESQRRACANTRKDTKGRKREEKKKNNPK